MSSEIEINGKVYTGKKANVQTLLKSQKIEAQMAKAVEKDKWDEHAKLSLDLARLFIDGDVSQLAADIISPVDGYRLNGFFSSCLAEGLPKSDSTKETSPGSTQSEPSPDSQTGTT